MSNEVKAALEPQLGTRLQQGAAHYYGFWLCYFLLSIGVVGGFFAYFLSSTFFLLGRKFRKPWNIGGNIMAVGVDTLLKVQPWLKADVELKLPPRSISISNHRSHLDMYFLLSRVSNVRAISRDSLFKVPFLGIMMWLMKMIPVKRGSIDSYLQAMEVAKRAALAGDPVHIFPEMSRCDLGFKGVQAFHLAPFKMIKDLNLPLVPIVFKNTDLAWPKDIFGLSFRKQVEVRTLPTMNPSDYATADALRAEAWKRISEAL